MLPALLLYLLASVATAGSFRIAPTLAEVAPGGTVASFRVTNSGAEALPIQIEPFTWTQENGVDRQAPATDLVIVPRIATIPPGKTQLIRVARRSAAREQETAYRIHFVELPVTGQAGFIGVRTTVRFDVPLFFAASQTPPKLQWGLSLGADGKVNVGAVNSGGRFVRMASVRVVDARGAVLAERKGPLYVLAGKAANWNLTTYARLAKGDSVIVEADVAGRREQQNLTVR